MLFSYKAKGRVLKRYRERIGISQTEVCQQTGFSHAQLSLTESGKGGFGDKKLQKLLDIYKVSRRDYISDVVIEEQIVEEEQKIQQAAQQKIETFRQKVVANTQIPQGQTTH